MEVLHQKKIPPIVVELFAHYLSHRERVKVALCCQHYYDCINILYKNLIQALSASIIVASPYTLELLEETTLPPIKQYGLLVSQCAFLISSQHKLNPHEPLMMQGLVS